MWHSFVELLDMILNSYELLQHFFAWDCSLQVSFKSIKKLHSNDKTQYKKILYKSFVWHGYLLALHRKHYTTAIWIFLHLHVVRGILKYLYLYFLRQLKNITSLKKKKKISLCYSVRSVLLAAKVSGKMTQEIMTYHFKIIKWYLIDY